MMENNNLSEILERAQAEENLYNWAEAARLYEEAGKSFLNKKKVKEAANAYKSLGHVDFLASQSADTKTECVDSLKRAIETYNKATNLFKQDKNKAEELECKAEVLFASGLITSNISDIKKLFSNSSDLFVEASNIYSKNDDQESLARTLSRAAFCYIFLQPFLNDKLEVDQFVKKGVSLASKALKISLNVGNLRLVSESVFSELMINLTQVFLKDFKKDPAFKEYLKDNIMKFDEFLKLFYNCDDNTALAMIYHLAGCLYCVYATHYIKDEKEFDEYIDKGLKLCEEALIFTRKANNKPLIILTLFYIDWWALSARKFKYIQNRIFKDVKEIENLGKIFSDSNNVFRFYAEFLPVFYYANMALRSFFTVRQRKTYAKKGIEHAKIALKGVSQLYYSAWPYQMLTYSYSQLTSLATSKEEKDEYAEKMLKYAKKGYDIGERYEGGVMRATGFSSLYRAYKTYAEISEDKERKIEMLSAAADASKKYLEHTPELWRGILIGQIRLALLYEEISIITGENDTLLQAEEVYKNIIKDGLNSRYYSYAAAAYEYLARIEDRLGNYRISAEQYVQVQECYLKSVIGVQYKLLKERIKEKISYANAWNLIELAKLHHKQENHSQAKKNYANACQILKELPSNNYEASYYYAWTFLEEAEDLSKKEKHDDAIEQFELSSEDFNNSLNVLEEALKKSKDKLENERIKKLKNIAKVRINYCSARVYVEKARLLGKKGDHLVAAEKFSSAASQFKDICTKFKLERERRELEAIYHLCRAWENMELAEKDEDSSKFAEAAHLFEKASNFFSTNKLKILSSGNSAFCQALELGCQFDETVNTKTKSELYPKIKVMLRKAASFYRKGGFENEANWALATSTYFDAAWHLIRADEEMNLEEKKKVA